MEDEDGYMVLSLKPRKELGKHNNRSQMQDASQCPRWQWIALLIGWAGNILLVVTVTVLAFQMEQKTSGTENKTYVETVSYLKQFLCKPHDNHATAFQMVQKTSGTENKTYVETVSYLKQFLCKLDNHATENSRCRLCPQNWSLHENKCYWVSKKPRTWHESEKDCAAKLSHMLVIENQEEAAFIQSIVEGTHLLWIGLTVTLPERKWTWVNGLPLDDKISQEIGPVEANSCGQLNENQIVSEACSAVTRWICKTDSLLI